MQHISCSTPDLAKQNETKLLELFPECAREGGGVDFDALRQCLSSEPIEGNVERYEFTWPGKRAAKAASSAATTKTLRPCRDESADFDKTGNLYIEGDNLEVLKLLQTGYAERVKMIYIDPPYNTGHDFVYRDCFSLTQKELDSQAGIFDEDGNRFAVNDSAEARYHSNWCSMMWPRLKLARNLLSDDGVIFISIDDNEVANLRKVCDEIFHASNFVNEIALKTNETKGLKNSNIDKAFPKNKEYLLVYAKNKQNLSFRENKVEKSEEELKDYVRYYSNYIEDPSLPCKSWKLLPFKDLVPKGTSKDAVFKLKMDMKDRLVYMVAPDNENEQVLVGKQNEFETVVNAKGKKVVYYRDEEGKLKTVLFLGENFTKNLGDLWTDISTININKESHGIPTYSNGQKPIQLLKRLLRYVMDPYEGGICLDFFAGSATTGQAVLEMNAEDKGNRRFILVQIEEDLQNTLQSVTSKETKKQIQKLIDFLNGIEKPLSLVEVGKERIRRAGKEIAETQSAENETSQEELDLGALPSSSPAGARGCFPPDIGFRVLKLDSSSLIDAGRTVGETKQGELALSRIREDRSPEDLLFQLLLETPHIPLSDSIATAKVGGNDVFFVGGTGEGAPLVACLDPKAKMDSQFFIEVAKLKPRIAFFRDDAFADDSSRTNLQQVFNQFSPTTSVKVI